MYGNIEKGVCVNYVFFVHFFLISIHNCAQRCNNEFAHIILQIVQREFEGSNLSKGQGETVYGGQGHGRKFFEKPDISQKLWELDKSFFCLLFVD